jgi:hypothetical protein
MATFVIHGYEGEMDVAWVHLKGELERRGFQCLLLRSEHAASGTPNHDRARAVVEALKDVTDDVVLVGISNQGLFMPLVAAQRPIRRIVMINAVVPTPGKTFRDAYDFNEVFRTRINRYVARRAAGMNEVFPLSELPAVEWVYVCGSDDEAIRPEWEQRVAREVLRVEPVVIPGAGHADIISLFAPEVADAATAGLVPSAVPVASAAVPRTPIEERARQARRQRPSLPIANLIISALAPLIAYFLIRPRVADDTTALALAWLIPVAWTLVTSVWRRRLNLVGIAGVVSYGTAVVITVYFGNSDLPLKLRHGVIAGVVGLVFIASVAINKPLLVVLARRRLASLASSGNVNAVWNDALTRRLKFLTLIIGVFALGDAVLQVVLALTLDTGDFLVATTVLHFATIALAAGTIILSLTRSAAR